MSDHPVLDFVEREDHLFASIRVSSERPPLELDTLRELVAQAGYAHWRLADAALAALLDAYNSASGEIELPIGERCDAAIAVEIAGDAMQAWVSVAFCGKAMEPEAIYQALGEAGVTFGIDQAVIDTLCADSLAGSSERFLIAAGLPAEAGEGTRFELLIDDARDRAPQLNEKGLIDFRELGAIPTVAAEQALMRRIPPTTGTIGRNVRGEVLEPVVGRNEAFADHLLGAYVATDDANLLRAVVSGQPIRCGNGVSVEPVFCIRNVNLATGNISFDGTVVIEGEVLPGMKVRETGDIVVGDVVDGAELDAGGDVRVAAGIIAKAHVKAGGSVSARFVENAQVSAGTTIAIDDTALQSDLQANNQIIVGLKARNRGRLAGGSARAMMLISAPILGLATGGVTRLTLGVNPELEARYQDLLKKIEKQREEEENLEKLVKHFTKQGDKAELLERAKTSWQHALQAWGRLLPEREELEKQLNLVAQARIDVGIAVEGAVDMAFGKKTLRLRRKGESGTFRTDGDQIVFTDPGGNLQPLS